MALGGIMGTPPRDIAVSGHVSGNNGSATTILKNNLSRLKISLDDDDDSSSDEDVKSPANVPISKGKRVKASDSTVRETSSRRTRIEKNANKKSKRAENKDSSNKNESEVKKPSRKTNRTDVSVKVRSERLQLKEAIMQSTTKAAMVTPDEKAKLKKNQVIKEEISPPRKRQRVSSSDSVAQEPAVADAFKHTAKTETSKPTRLTRQSSRELAKKHEENEVATNEMDIDDPLDKQRGENPVSDVDPTSDTLTHQDDVESLNGREAITKKAGENDRGAVIKPKKMKPSSELLEHEDAAVPHDESKPVEVVKKSLQPRRRSKVISDESDNSEAEFMPSESKSENHDSHDETQHNGESNTATFNGVEVSDEKKRRRLKRPLSATSSNGSKSLSLSSLLEREKTATLVMTNTLSNLERSKKVVKREKLVGKVKADKVARDVTNNDMQKTRKNREMKTTVTRPEDGRVGKQYRLKGDPDRIKARMNNMGAEATTLDDYIKEHESREVVKRQKKRVLEGDGSEPVREALESSSAEKETKRSVRTASGDHETVKPSTEVQGHVDAAQPANEKEVANDIEPNSNDFKSDEHHPSPKDAKPSCHEEEQEEEEEEEEEEGAVSDQEISVTAQAKVDAISTAESQTEVPDPMSFVIPKKRLSQGAALRSPSKKVATPRHPASIHTSIPAPSPSPVSSVEMNLAPVADKPKPRSKNAVPSRMHPLSQQERDFFRLAEKSNSILKAASFTKLRGSKATHPRLVSAFGCTSDRYCVLLESGAMYVESTTRMACPTRKEIKKGNHPASFFGVTMAAPPDQAQGINTVEKSDKVAPTSPLPCYETLEFTNAKDRDWYLERMYGTTFVPQLLRERVTLVMRNARYERKSTGLLFNAQRDKEEYAAQIAERYKVNRSIPRCDINPKNWQQLVNGRVSFVFLHYMNREDAMIARDQFKDDDGQPLIIKGESKANEPPVSTGMRFGMSPGMSPPPMSSPPQRRRSRSRSSSPSRRFHPSEQRGRQFERDRTPSQRHTSEGPWSSRDRTWNRGRWNRRQSIDAQNGNYNYGLRPPSRSRSRSPRRPVNGAGRPTSPVSSQQNLDAHESTSESVQMSQDMVLHNDVELGSQGTLHSSQATGATQDGSMNGEESFIQDPGHQTDRAPEQSARPQRRLPSRSRSRPRMPDDRQMPPYQHGRRGSEDQSFQPDRRTSGEHHGHGRDGRFGRSPPPRMQFDDRDRRGREFDRDYHQHGRYEDRPPPPRESDRRGHHGKDPHRRQHPQGQRRFR